MENNKQIHNNDQESDGIANDSEKDIEKSMVHTEDGYNLEDYDEDEEIPELDSDTTSSNPSSKATGKRKRTAGDAVRYIIMAIAAAVFLYSAFMLIKIYFGYKQGTDIYESIANTVLVQDQTQDADENTTDKVVPFKYVHDELLRINPEGIGYLYIPSVSVELPLVQGTDNDYYLTHTFNRRTNGAGALFEDYRISGGLSSSHVIVYGHNMKNGSMFAGLTKYLTPSFYQTEGNDLFYIYTQNKMITYKIFAAYISEPVSDTYTYNFGSLDSLRSYAESMKALSAYNTGVDISNATQIVTFSTCTADGSQRIIVQGTYLSESLLEQ